MRTLLFLGLFGAATAAFAVNDPAIVIDGPDHVVAGSIVVYGAAVNSVGTGAFPPSQRVTGRLLVPPQLAPFGTCYGGAWDPVSRVLTWSETIDNYNVGTSCVLFFRVNPSLTEGATLTLNASFTTTLPDADPANNSASLIVVASASADVEVKTTRSALSLTPGSELDYTITVTNLGALEARNVVLSDETSSRTRFIQFAQTSGPPASILTPLPGGYGTVIAKIATLPAGASATFKLFVRVDPAVETVAFFNQAIIDSDTDDPNQENNNHSLVVYVGPDVDLKVASRAPGMRDTRFPITIDVANDGPQTVKNVSVDMMIDGDASKVEYAGVTPSQGTCSAPELYSIPASPPPPSFWRVQCNLGTLTPGATATITAIIDTKPGKVTFKHVTFVNSYNDPNLPNNHSDLLLTNHSSGRTRAVRK